MRKEDELKPRDHAEAVALFRVQVVGDLAARQLEHGDLAAELRERSREHPSMSASLIVRTLERKGRLAAGEISANTARRLYREHGLERLSKRHQTPGHHRRRWEAAYAGQLWHRTRDRQHEL